MGFIVDTMQNNLEFFFLIQGSFFILLTFSKKHGILSVCGCYKYAFMGF